MNYEDATTVHRIHDNDRPPNYRENGQLRLVHCFDCDTKLVHFGSSDITCCPECQWSEQSVFDWNEFQSTAFEALFVVVMSQYPKANPSVAASIAYDIINSAAGSYGAMALGDGLEGYIRVDVHEELMEAPTNDAHPASFDHEKYIKPEFYIPNYAGTGGPIFLPPRRKVSPDCGHRRTDQAEVLPGKAPGASGRSEKNDADGDHQPAQRREEPRHDGSSEDSACGGDRAAWKSDSLKTVAPPVFQISANDPLAPDLLKIFAIMLKRAGREDHAKNILGLDWDFEIWRAHLG